MECGEIWVKQKNDLDESSGEHLIVVNGRNNRRHRRRQLLKQYWEECGFVRWLKRKFATNDRAKRADYLSRLIFPAMFLIFNCAYWLRYSQYQVSKPT
ncbi:unnamed protein product [Gongylonema pulchrum]|uniref:Transposase n=1 Tax=Gongylonema pulchrum TaxID=637853 RepID=A0A183CZB4_9BILA|nr:unnamed protein product [Gongylonema pulchrum]